MDEELLQGFIEEAEGYLPTIRQGIEVYGADPARIEDLKTSYRQVHTIKGAALMVGLPEIGAFAKTLQDALDEIVSANSILSRERAAALLGEVSRLEKMFGGIGGGSAESSSPEQKDKAETTFETNAALPLDERFQPTASDDELPTATEDESDELFALDESIFEPEILTTQSAPAEREPEKFAAADFEIDAEMREVFALEAEQHLRSITANLSLLERDWRDRHALLEIRRSSHTLKGSAGIVGFQKIAALAHAQEDLLDFLAENEGEIPAAENKSIVKILLAATDCLEALSANQSSPELEQKIYEIQAGFRRLLERLKTTAAADAATVKPAKTESSASSAVILEAPTAEAPRPDTVVPVQAIEEAAAAAADIHAAQSANANLNSNQNQNQNPTVIRVSLERLDDLVRLVSQMVVSRSAFEQRLAGLRRQIEELHQSTRRLQRLSGKIETDFASSALEGGGGGGANCLPNQPSSHNVFGRESFNAFYGAGGGEEGAASDEEFDFLELDRYTEFHQTARELSETASDAAAVNAELDALTNHLGLLFDAQRGLFDEMQHKLLRLRMVPFATLSSRLQRTARVTADEEGKLVEFFIEGETLEIDSEILHFIVEPLLHLLRNAVAHGIEPAATRRLLGKSPEGRITLNVSSEGAHIVLTVTDDGRGISAAALKEKAVAVGFISAAEAEAMTEDDAFSLIFLPGLSTAEKVNQVSGRGVGMNVVKSSVLRQQGSISVKSEARKGTTFTLRIPTALAVTRVLLVKANNQTFAVPLKIVRRVTEISRREFEAAKAAGALRVEGRNFAVAHLNELLGFPAAASTPDSRVLLLLIESAETAQALAVEQILKPEEVVIKPLGGPLKSVAEFLGATVLGDGEVVPILDLIPLLAAAAAAAAAAANRRRKNYATVENQSPKTEISRPKTALSVLIVDDSPSVRQINSRTIKNAGWLPIAAKDGLEALELLEATTVSGESELPDVILTDVEMPRMDGYELLAALKQRENLRRIPVVMITSRGGDKHRRKAFDLGVSEYLTKPYEDSVLIEKVKSLARV